LTERLERRQIQRCTFIFILYIFAGAFLFLEEIMEKELMKKKKTNIHLGIKGS
jgi:hypothetical protein